MDRSPELEERLVLIAMLLAAFSSKRDSSPESGARAYLMAVDDFSNDAIRAAVSRFVKGTIPNRNHAFVPSAPELAIECRLQTMALRTADRNLALRHPRDGSMSEFSVEHRKKIQSQMALLAAGRLQAQDLGNGNK
jgi:hypothetical protein